MDRNRNQEGIAALGLIVVLGPLLFLVTSYLQTMSGRTNRLQLDYMEERALLAAESGIDVAIYESRCGTLVAGPMAQFVFEGALPSGDKYQAIATYLGADLVDNDDDLAVDAADPDEDVFRVECTGRAGSYRRRVATYLGFSSFITAPTAAATVVNQNPNIRITGAALIDGHNHDLAGNLVGAGGMAGLAISPPATTANLLATLTPMEQSRVVGSTPTPSLTTSSTYTQTQVDEILVQARNSAQVVLTNGTIAGTKVYGTIAGPQYIVYREGDLRIQGDVSGAGLLMIHGDLTITGTMSWTGVVVCTGRLLCGSGTARLSGGVIIGEAGNELDLRGTVDLRFSGPALQLAMNLTGRYVAFNGWQELSIY
jgi:hypothetical protein